MEAFGQHPGITATWFEHCTVVAPVVGPHHLLMGTGTRRRLSLLPGAQWLQARTPAVTHSIMQCLMVANNMLKWVGKGRHLMHSLCLTSSATAKMSMQTARDAAAAAASS
jgi:hypothetical protein